MFNHRKYISRLVEMQELLRIEMLTVYCSFDFTKLDFCISKEEKVNDILKEINELVKESKDDVFFIHYNYLVKAVFHLTQWVKHVLAASPNSGNHLKAAKVNMSLIDIATFPYPETFSNSLSIIINKVNALDQNVVDVKDIFSALKYLPYPALYEIENNPFSRIHKDRQVDEIEPPDDKDVIPVVSIEFLIDHEPWANPQILQPGKVYLLQGRVRVNAWPNGFDQLILHPISAENQSNYILELPAIMPFKEKTLDISGTVVFKYPQHNFDDNLSVRLLCYFQRADGTKLLPLVIGYDQLIAKVLDPNFYDFMTGFSSMSSALADVAIKLSNELPMLDKKERNDFLKLLRGILNYQGYCLQQGVYKNETNVAESVFRDRLIQHLIGLSYLGEAIVKEAELAGGRVEISYNGIIAELKSESRISDRNQLIQKYGSQPTAYASGNGKQLSILCILDLTEKINPPAPPRNNIIVHSPKVHGHDGSELEYPPMQVAVIIDGNTKKPSDYSK